MWNTFFHNMLIIIGFLYIILMSNDFSIKKNISSKMKAFIHTILASFLSIIVMSLPFTYAEMSIDIRSVPIFIISYLYGPKLGLVSCILPSLFRIYMGGPIAFKGIILKIISPMIVGSLFHNDKKTGFMEKNIKIKRILFSYFIYCIVRALLLLFMLDIPYILCFKLVISMTTLSSISVYCAILLINDYTKKILFIKEIEEKQQRIENLVEKLQHTNNTLHTLINAMPIGVVVSDENKNIILANTTAKEIIDDLEVDKPYYPKGNYTLHQKDGRVLPISQLPLSRSIEKNEFVKNLEILLRYKDGTEKNILNASTPVYDTNGQIINGINVFQDISNLKVIEKRLREGQKIRESFLNSITEIMVLLSKNGKIIDLNEASVQQLGLTTKDLIGKCLYDFLPAEHLKTYENRANAVIQSRKSIQFETKINDRYFDVTLYPILDNNRDVEKMTAFCKDISHLKESQKIKKQFIEKLSIEQEKLKENNQKLILLSKQHLSTLEILYKKNEQLNIANTTKNKFIANISHELKTPLNITLTYIEYLLEEQEGPLNTIQKQFLKTAYDNAERLQYLINDLLDLSLLDTMTIKFNYENINITKFIKIIATDRKLSLKDTLLNINVSVPDNDIYIIIDPLRFRQAIDNILDNAIKFSNGGTIHIILKENKHDIEIHINDCGIGITQNKINDIFNPFYQIDDSSKKKYKGAGLGLSIAKKIITAFGGEISVSSRINKGSSFKIRIPFNCTLKEDINEKNIYC